MNDKFLKELAKLQAKYNGNSEVAQFVDKATKQVKAEVKQVKRSMHIERMDVTANIWKSLPAAQREAIVDYFRQVKSCNLSHSELVESDGVQFGGTYATKHIDLALKGETWTSPLAPTPTAETVTYAPAMDDRDGVTDPKQTRETLPAVEAPKAPKARKATKETTPVPAPAPVNDMVAQIMAGLSAQLPALVSATVKKEMEEYTRK